MDKKDFKANVIVAVFKVESEGFQALSELRQAAAGESYFVSAAALLKKDKNVCNYLDGFDTGVQTENDALLGGLIGMTIGILAGPLGVLLGGSYGALIGSTVDVGDAAFGLSMLDQIADKLDDGMVALVALAEEETEDALNAKLSAFDTTIARFDAEVVADEVDRAYEKQFEMARQAKMQIREERRAELRKELEENAEILSSNFRK